MQTIVYERNPDYDRSRWAKGEWDNEPDKIQWQDDATGLPCIARRNDWGVWCGYVGVTEGHPLFGKSWGDTQDTYNDDTGHWVEAEHTVSVHGGLTFADSCVDEAKEFGICHKPDPGEPDHVWWLGFDCGHGLDVVPAFTDGQLSDRETYKSVTYVKSECKLLALQLKAMK